MMRRLMFFAIGLMFGAAFGATITLLLTPASGKSMRKGVKSRLDRVKYEARRASETRRRELEAQLAALTRPSSTRRTSTRR
jgi:gas vesicle protein